MTARDKQLSPPSSPPAAAVDAGAGGAARRSDPPRESLAELAAQSGELMAICDREGALTYCNAAAARLLGVPIAESAAAPHASLVELTAPEDQRVMLDDFLARIGRDGRAEVEVRLHKAGANEPGWFALRGTAIDGAAAAAQQIAVIGRDIGERKRLESQLAALSHEFEHRVQERTRSLSEAAEQMEEFSYTVSHDLRAPLRAMAAYAHALLEDYSDSLDETALYYVNRIIRGSQYLDQLTQDMLSYSRIARADVQCTRVEPERVLREVIEHYPAFQPPAATVHIESPLHPMRAHEWTLSRCLANLLSNAVKFVPPTRRPNVSVCTERSAGQVRLWVQDNGIGVRPEYHRQIFEMFRRVNPGGAFDGTGVGLAIVRKGVERMGGKVGVESDGTFGSRFWIQLPEG